MKKPYRYYRKWEECKKKATYNTWSSGTSGIGLIIEYHNNMGKFIFEYTDAWSIDCKNSKNYLAKVKIECESLHAAKLMGDKVQKEFHAADALLDEELKKMLNEIN